MLNQNITTTRKINFHLKYNSVAEALAFYNTRMTEGKLTLKQLQGFIQTIYATNFKKYR